MVTMDNLNDEVEINWRDICNSAIYFNGVTEVQHVTRPDWFEHDKFAQAQRFLRGNVARSVN